MKKKLFYIYIFQSMIFSLSAKEISLIKSDHRNNLEYVQSVKANVDENSEFTKKYRSVQKFINLQVDYPRASIVHTAKDKEGKIEFSKSYSTTDFGFRFVPQNPKSKNYLILAGDSNTFGIGCNDDETLTYHLSKLLPETQVINMGMAGTAGNALLYFLEHYQMKEVLPRPEQQGTMLYDFNDYLMERMIGGKNFIKWGWMQPAYELERDHLIFKGTFNQQWITKFYKFINLIDPKNILFPNLPRFHDHHYKLVARIFLEVKKKFLEQTRPDNRFAVLIHPFTLNAQNRPIINHMLKEFKELGIETVQFNEEEALKHIYIYPLDLHMTPQGQAYYAKLIYEKMAKN